MAPRYIGSSAVTGRKPPSGWYRASSRICCAASSFASPDTVASQSNITVRWYAVAMIAFSGSTQYDGMVARTSSTSNMHRGRSEEHTSELQSPYDLVCRLLLEKKKNQK